MSKRTEKLNEVEQELRVLKDEIGDIQEAIDDGDIITAIEEFEDVKSQRRKIRRKVKQAERIESEEPINFDPDDMTHITEQPGTNRYKLKIGYRNFGLFNTIKDAQHKRDSYLLSL